MRYCAQKETTSDVPEEEGSDNMNPPVLERFLGKIGI